MSSQIQSTPRSRVRRLPQRGSYDRTVINQVLDEGIVAHAVAVAVQPDGDR